MTLEYEEKPGKDLRYFGLGRECYYRVYRYVTQKDSPDWRIDQILEDPIRKEARRLMFDNVVELEKQLSDLDLLYDPNVSYETYLYSISRKIAEDSAKLLPEDDRNKALGFLKKLDDDGMLFDHQRSTRNCISSFFKESSRLSPLSKGILPKSKHGLLEVAGMIHDTAKLMGGLNAQIDSDHEVIFKGVIGKHLVGKSFRLENGEMIILDSKDVGFITSVVGFHEDIWREADFAKQAESLKRSKDSNDPEVQVQRARTIMHFIDIFGSAVSFKDGALSIVDNDAFKKRFIDLFQRHIQLPISGTESQSGVDWTLAKVFRPQWGMYGVAGLTHTFSMLQTEWGINVDPNLIGSVQHAILNVLEQAEADIIHAQKGNEEYLSEQLLAIQSALVSVHQEIEGADKPHGIPFFASK